MTEMVSLIEIKKHDFDREKERIKEFSEKNNEALSIKKVNPKGAFLGLGNHKVTGIELNERISTIQKHLVDINTINNKTIREFGEIYKTFDTLDKEYISSIVASVKAIEKTSNDVKVQQEELESHQVKIEKSVENIDKITKILNKFKEKLDGYDHLKDIDEIWSDYKKLRQDIQAEMEEMSKQISSSIKKIDSKNNQLIERLNKEINDIKNKLNNTNNNITEIQDHFKQLDSFINSLNIYQHLKDVDSMWNDISNIKEETTTISENINKNKEKIKTNQEALARLKTESLKHKEQIDDLFKRESSIKEYANTNRKLIEELQTFRENVKSIEHIHDIDSMWEKESILSANLTSNNESIISLQDKTVELDNNIQDQSKKTQANLTLLEKKLKYTYFVAGGSLGIVFIELILILFGVI